MSSKEPMSRGGHRPHQRPILRLLSQHSACLRSVSASIWPGALYDLPPLKVGVGCRELTPRRGIACLLSGLQVRVERKEVKEKRGDTS